MLKLDLWNIIATVINILLFYAIIRRFLLKPIDAVIEKRKNQIQFEQSQAAQRNEEALKSKESYDEKLSEIAKKEQALLTQAENEAAKEAEQLIAAAREKSEQIIEAAKEKAEHIRAEAQAEAKEKIAMLAMEAAVKIINETQRRMYEPDRG